MRISGKADYAVRAMVELASARRDDPIKASAIAEAQAIPMRFLEQILVELKQGGLVISQPGAGGGYWLAKEPSEITIADVVRSVDGVLASVHGEVPETATYEGSAEPLRDVWVALRANVCDVLEGVSLADVASATLPDRVRALASRPGDAASR